MTNYTMATSVDPTVVASAVLGLETTTPSVTEHVEPAVEATPTLQQTLVSRVPAVDQGSFHSCSQKRNLSLREAKGDCDWSPYCSATRASKEKGSFLRIGDYVFLSIEEPTWELIVEEQLVLALNASMDMA